MPDPILRVVAVNGRVDVRPFPTEAELGAGYRLRGLDPMLNYRYGQELEYVLGFDMTLDMPHIEMRAWNAVMLNPPEMPA